MQLFSDKVKQEAMPNGNSPSRCNQKSRLKMYAIVEILGQQFKVEAGRRLYIHRMEEAERGSQVEFDKVLLIDNEGTITVGAPTVAGAKIVCEVLSHVRGEKVIVFHKKRRKGYRKRNGHRQNYTELFNKEIVA